MAEWDKKASGNNLSAVDQQSLLGTDPDLAR